MSELDVVKICVLVTVGLWALRWWAVLALAGLAQWLARREGTCELCFKFARKAWQPGPSGKKQGVCYRCMLPEADA